MKPDWVIKLEEEPCQCVSCSLCGGTGTVWFSFGGKYLGRTRWDDLDEAESCDNCHNGTIETCSRCEQLEDWDRQCEDEAEYRVEGRA